MSKKSKTIIWLCLFILVICLAVFIATYAYFNVNKIIKGKFEVDISSKGIDTFQILDKKDGNIEVTFNNFMKNFGHDVSDSATMKTRLTTTNKNAKYCYKVDVILPEEKVFEYTDENPELLLSVKKSDESDEYINLITNMDITEKTGTISVPVSSEEEEYVHFLETNKNEESSSTFEAELTFVYKNINQEINNHKNYKLSLEANVVDCN